MGGDGSMKGFDWLYDEPCITCGAEVNNPCVTMSGHAPGTPTPPHAERISIKFAIKGNCVGIPEGGFVDVVDR